MPMTPVDGPLPDALRRGMAGMQQRTDRPAERAPSTMTRTATTAGPPLSRAGTPTLPPPSLDG